MSEYPSWSDERDTYADASWGAAPPAPPTAHYGGSAYGADSYASGDPYASRAAPGGYGGYDNRGSAGYGGAAGGYGNGGGFNSSYVSTPNKPTGAAKASEISFDTSSRDPAHLRARVFIGCLGNSAVVREDIIELCRPFGPLMAVTLFKQGYAFVQFEQAEDADNACEVLNGKRWKGVSIDVHLAMEGLVRKTLPQKRGAERGGRGGGGMGGGSARGGGAGGGGGGGGSVNDYQGQSAAKRPRASTGGLSGGMGEEALLGINEQNRKNALADTSAPEMIGSEMADTLICGTCRYVTSDFIAYREHRKKQCVKPKDTVEPPVLRCASCGLRFLNAWKMLFHLTDFHRMQLFKPDYAEDAYERAKAEDDKYKNVCATRMEAWRAEMEAEKTSTFVVEPAPAAAAPTTGEEQHRNGQQPAAASQSKTSFANDDNVDTFGGAGGGGGEGAVTGSGSSAPKERITTGADYDEDEEDDDDGQPQGIPTLG